MCHFLCEQLTETLIWLNLQLGKKFCNFAFSKFSNVSTQALSALTEFIRLSPDSYVIFVLHTMLETIQKLNPQLLENILIGLKNLCFILDFYTSHMEKEGGKVSIGKLLFILRITKISTFNKAHWTHCWLNWISQPIYSQYCKATLKNSLWYGTDISDSKIWKQIREPIEQYCLIWLIHSDPQVWTKALVLLSILQKDILR